MLKNYLKKTYLANLWKYYCKLKAEYTEKFIVPSYMEKRAILIEYKNYFELSVLIETGTFLGDTLEAFKNDFKRLYSFELSQELSNKCAKMFGKNGRCE